MHCPICEQKAPHFHTVDGIDYFDCGSCDFIFADREFLTQTDSGGASREYKEEYWKAEIASAIERSNGGSLALFGEAVLCARIPIERVIDIGTGPGFLPAALQRQMPSSAHKFFGVEAFPPPVEQRAKLLHPENYQIGFLGDLSGKFELGTCIEVFEHLTPGMMQKMAIQMKGISVPGSLFAINTGLTDYVRKERNLDYLDPFRRGHITSWSKRAIDKIFHPLGFRCHLLHGRSWAFFLEYEGSEERPFERIWGCLPENEAILKDAAFNSLMYITAVNSARAYAFEEIMQARSA